MAPCGIYSFLSSQFSNGNFSTTIADIRLRASYPGNRIVVVEGESDSIVLSDFFDSTIHILFPFCKGNAEKIIQQLDYNYYKNVIAILDKDYDRISCDARVFYYDYCNLEMMLISHDSLFDNFLTPDLSKEDLLSMRDDIIYHLKPISCLRLLNSMSRSTHCKCFSTKEAIGTIDCMLFSNSDLILYIQGNIIANLTNPNLSVTDKNAILNAFNNNINALMANNAYDISNGHDFNKELIKKLPSHLSIDETCGANSIYRLYKNALSEVVFKSTNLYSDIKKYERNTNLVFLAP